MFGMAVTQPTETGKGQAAGLRFIVRETSDGLGIVVPLARDKGLMFTFGMFPLCWAVIGFFDLFLSPGLLPPATAARWRLCAVAAGWRYRSRCAGQEAVRHRAAFIVSGSLVFSRGLGFFGRRRIFPLDKVRNTRIRTRYVRSGNKGGPVLRSTISFEVHGKTYDFGADEPGAILSGPPGRWIDELTGVLSNAWTSVKAKMRCKAATQALSERGP